MHQLDHLSSNRQSDERGDFGMKETLTRDEVVQLIEMLSRDMIEARDELRELDAAIGDGDLGVTVMIGFQAVESCLPGVSTRSMDEILSACSSAFADNAASTFGALMATVFSRASLVMKKKETLGIDEAIAILRSSVEGVQERGGAELGDKTMLDSMIPALAAMEHNRQSLLQGLEAAAQAARKGAEDTAKMRARTGRSAYLGERTVGALDPGAVAFCRMAESVARSIRRL